VPELAIEVVTTSGTINKLDVYRGLGVPEVWFWKENHIAIYWLGQNGYEEATRSWLLPNLDIAELAGFISPTEGHTKVVRAYRARLRAKAPAGR
jgi:Uma2 family endonuclease